MNVQRSANMLDNYWMPFSVNRDFKQEPRFLVRAEGMYYWNHKGEKLLDGCAGLFTHAAGHRPPSIVEAIKNQLDELDYLPPFQFAQPGAFDLAQRIAELTPGALNQIFFTNSGSESVDTAMKVALQYHRLRGDGQRTRFVGRERAYHGVNFGGISVGGMVRNRESFGTGLPGVHHMRATWLPEQKFSVGQPSIGVELADDLERIAQTYGPDTIAACIVEPIAGSTGVLVPPKDYLERLREICDRHGILLIFDEVICAFGRTGKAFGAQAFNVKPDIITMAKALTNGMVPMGAVAFSDQIYDTLVNSAPEGSIELFHGYTYSAHPLACAAAIAALDLYRDEEIFEQAAAMSPKFLDLVYDLRSLDIVTDIRGYGMLAAIELAPGESPGERGYAVLKKCFEAGLVLRVTADTPILSPALIATENELEQMVGILKDVIQQS